jgi:hypothetical protein
MKELAGRVMESRLSDLKRALSVAVTYDGWKGTEDQGKVVVLVYHWLDDAWTLRHAALDLIEVSASQTSASPGSLFADRAVSWTPLRLV